MSPNLSTTRKRTGGTSANLALDHILVTHDMLDEGVSSWVDQSRWISDHYPVMAKWKAALEPTLAWRWPKPMKIGAPCDLSHVWSTQPPTTYEAWSARASKWIADVFQVPKESKSLLTTGVAEHPPSSPSVHYSMILKVQNIVASLRNGGEHSEHLALIRINRRLRILGVEPVGSRDEAETVIDQVLKKHLDDSQERALSVWRSKILTWNAQAGDAYKYLKNVRPAKACVILDGSGNCVSDPSMLGTLLSEYWSQVEAWPTTHSLQSALDTLDDKYALFLPRVDVKVFVGARELMQHFKKKKLTSPGPDGWSREELASLPLIAWEQLLDLWNERSRGFIGSSLFWFRRVPIEKGDSDTPTPAMFRPIDVYSNILRGISTVQVQSMRPWLDQVLFETQYASRHGVLEAIGSLNTYAEAAYHRVAILWAISIDYKKLFNTISYVVAIAAAKLMGLTDEDARLLQAPFEAGVG